MMRWVLVCVLLFVGHVGWSDDSVDKEDRPDTTVVDQVFGVFDLVMRRHIDPPTRQALVQGFCRHLNLSPDDTTGIGREISRADEPQLYALVAAQIEKVSVGGRRTAVDRAIDRSLTSLASSRLVKQLDQRAQEQLAENRYVGIGIALGMKNDMPVMMQIFPGGPAHQVGSKKGDLIVRVDGEATKGKSIQEVVHLLRGPEATDVNVVLQQPDGPEREYMMTRGVVPIDHIGDLQLKEPDIGYVAVGSITGSILRDLRALTPEIRRLGLKGLVIEINSTDTSFRPSLTLCNALIDAAPIGAVLSQDGTEVIQAEAGSLWPDIQLAFVTDLNVTHALAWSLDALKREREAVLVGKGNFRFLRAPADAYQFESIELPDSDWSIVLPVSRLLSIKRDESGEFASYGNPTISYTHDRQQLLALEHAQMVRVIEEKSPRDAKVERGTPVDRAVALLRERIRNAE